MELIDFFKSVYNSEINISIKSFWDSGYEFALGDEMNGFKCKAEFDADDFESGIEWLRQKIYEHYPNSVFTKVNQ